MALPIFQRTVTDAQGNIISGATVTVRFESTGLNAPIYSNRAGTTAKSNPFTTGADGLAQFYAAPGEYRITATSGIDTVTWNYQVLSGTSATLDAVESNTDVTDNRLLKTGASFVQLGIDSMGLEYRPLPKPTLDLDFANQKFEIYSKLNGFETKPLADIVSQGRSTAGTSTDALGGVTEFAAGENRFTFDGETGEALGYLSEESRTNLLTYSEFPNGLSDAPSLSGLVSLSTMDLGSGDVNALAFGYDGSTTSFASKTNFSPTIGVTYTLSVFVEMDDGLAPSFLSGTPSSIQNDFHINVAGNSGSPLTYSVKKHYGNVYKVSNTVLAATASTANGIQKSASNSTRTFKVTGWQLEVGSFPTSYIKTLGTAVVRSADAMTRTLGQEWNPNEGTFVVEFELIRSSPSTGFYSVLSQSSNTNFLWLFVSSIDSGFRSASNGGAETLISGVSANKGVKYKAAISSTRSAMSISINGSSTVSASTSGSLLDMTSFNIGLNVLAGELKYYPRAFDPLTLQRLSRIQ